MWPTNKQSGQYYATREKTFSYCGAPMSNNIYFLALPCEKVSCYIMSKNFLTNFVKISSTLYAKYGVVFCLVE